MDEPEHGSAIGTSVRSSGSDSPHATDLIDGFQAWAALPD